MAAFTIFDKSISKAYEWVEYVMEDLGWKSEVNAYLALRATLHSIRDTMSADAAFVLGTRLPLVIRGIFFESYEPGGKPLPLDKELFLSRVHSYLNYDDSVDPEQVSKAVFGLIQAKLSGGEYVKDLIPQSIAEMWPQPKMKV